MWLFDGTAVKRHNRIRHGQDDVMERSLSVAMFGCAGGLGGVQGGERVQIRGLARQTESGGQKGNSGMDVAGVDLQARSAYPAASARRSASSKSSPMSA